MPTERAEQLAQELGRELARELYDSALRMDQGQYIERYGFPLPEEQVVVGAASFLEYKARKIRNGENWGGADPDADVNQN